AWGVLHDDIYPIEGQFNTTAEFLVSGQQQAFAVLADLQAHAEHKLNPDAVELLSPVTNPCQVLCQGANYRQHMIESGMNPDAKTFNMMFNKSAACINSPDGDIVRPAHVKLLDYEIELGLVIGKQVTQPQQVAEEQLGEYVAGIVIGNDISARDIQIPQMQFFKGKSYRTFCPVGPYLCLLQGDDYKYLDKLQLTLKVNGEVRQSDNTSELVFKPAETLSELSQVADLNVGDLVLTGTPAGCALRAPKPFMVRLLGLLPEHKKWPLFIKKQAQRAEYLQPGDTIESTIASDDGVVDLGTQKNTIVG
ncbi:MAG: fumarylacetoacetate hydrolase family protein, partial [Arenicella sp.]|nr:fumarylacetoacetate hydrolase family protein [Arenicella sp.]